MSFFRRLIGALGASSPSWQGVQVGDRYVKTDGQFQTTWVVRQIVYFDGIPPHARLANDHEYELGYRTISVVALEDPDLYRRATPDSGSAARRARRNGSGGAGRTGGPAGMGGVPGRRPAPPRLSLQDDAHPDPKDASNAAMKRPETVVPDRF